jgi:hypothetical protein
MAKDAWDKLNIVVSNIILVAIPIVIAVVGDNISRSLERGKFIDSLLDDLTTPKVGTRRDIALIALDSAIPPPKHESQTDQVVDIAEILLKDTIAGVKQQEVTKRLESSAANKIILKRKPKTGKSIVLSIVSDLYPTGETKKESSQSQEIISSLIPDKKIIYITFRGDITRDMINKMRESFQEQGWISPPAIRKEEVSMNSVNYFHESDRELAKNIAKVTNNLFTSQNCTQSNVELKPNFSKNKNKGEIELLIYNKCKGT